MSLPFHLLFCLSNRPAKTIIHLFMNTILILIPNQIWYIINRCLQKMFSLPEIFTHFVILPPPLITEPELFFRHRHDPHIFDVIKMVHNKIYLTFFQHQNQLCFSTLCTKKQLNFSFRFISFQSFQIRQYHIRCSCGRRFQTFTPRILMREIFVRGNFLYQIKCSARYA